MEVLVAIKRVLDYKTSICLNPDGKTIDTSRLKMAMNPFDEIALEEAIRLKEKNIVHHITAISIGPSTTQETLRTALAMGADQAILITTEVMPSPIDVASIIHAIIARHTFQLVLLGKQAVDTDDNQVGQMLAGKLNWSQGTFASSLDFHDGGVTVVREIDGGLETLFLTLPAVITTDLRLNQPRYIALPNIIKAKQKPLELIPLDDLNLPLNTSLEIMKLTQPQKKRKQIKVDTVKKLVSYLHHDEKVI